jgi:hypothetical protein
MNLRSTIGLCAVVIGVFSVSLCQPPTPRIAEVEGPADVVVSSINVATQNSLIAFESAEQAIQVRDPYGLLSNFLRRSH